MEEKTIKIIIVDDHQIMVDGIKALLINDPAFQITGECNRAADVLAKMEEETPHVLITDIQMPEMSGVELTRTVKEKWPEVKILALSMFGEQATIADMLEAGVDGYILKNTGREELISAIKTVTAGQRFFSADVAAEVMKGASRIAQTKTEEKRANLSPREKEILQLISEEKSNKIIAEELFISERTVETHRKHIFKKTGTKTIVGLIKYAMENNLI